MMYLFELPNKRPESKSVTINVLFFSAPWCQPCKQLDKVIDELLPSFPEINVVKVDIDKSKELVAANHVTSVPTLVSPRGRMAGAATQSRLRQFFRQAMGE